MNIYCNSTAIVFLLGCSFLLLEFSIHEHELAFESYIGHFVEKNEGLESLTFVYLFFPLHSCIHSYTHNIPSVVQPRRNRALFA